MPKKSNIFSAFESDFKYLDKEVCIGDHRLKTDIIVALHLLIHMEVGSGAVTFIKTLKLSERQLI